MILGVPSNLVFYDPPIQITDRDVDDLDEGIECTTVMGGFQINNCDDGYGETSSV